MALDQQQWPNDLRAFWMPFTANRQFKKSPRMFVSADGMFYRTTDGRDVLDGTAGLWCCNAGHNRPRIVEAIQKQVAELDYAPAVQMSHRKAFLLANQVIDMAPEGIDHAFFTNSGSESVDSALKIALAYHNVRGKGSKFRLIGRERGYHGVNFGGTSVGGIVNNRRVFGSLLSGVDHLRHTHLPDRNAFTRGCPEHGAELAEDLERLAALHGGETIAAVIIEPVAGSTGVLVPPVGYLERIREICDKHGILLIFDEVITGFGRLGESFASQRFGVTPDMITCAKGLTSGYLPLGATLISREVFDVIGKPIQTGAMFTHGFTYSGHPVCCAAGLKNIEIMERDDLCGHVLEVGPYLEEQLATLRDLPIVGDVRGKRFMMCVENVADRETRALLPDEAAVGARIAVHAQKRGVIVRPIAHLNVLSPPLTMTKRQVDELVGVLRESIVATMDDLRSEGLWSG